MTLLPARPVAGPVWRMDRSVSGLTVVITVPVLLFAFISSSKADTVAMFVTIPIVVAVALIITVAEPPLVRGTKLNETTPLLVS